MPRLFIRSKRQRLVYLIMLVWVCFAVAGFYYSADFMALATYFGTFAGPTMTYLWGETRRPSGTDIS